MTYQFSFYGILLLSYLFTQLSFSFLNHRENLKNQSLSKQILSSEIISNQIATDEMVSTQILSNGSYCNSLFYKCVLLIVGRQEKKEYWKNCLLSVKELVCNRQLIHICIIIDGDKQEDIYMKEMANEILNLNEFSIETNIFMIPQRGKRGAMFFGLQQIHRIFHFDNKFIDVIVTDSDTIISPFAPTHLQTCLRSDPKNGCVTGTLDIFNIKDGILPKMINARYHYAFQIERAAGSYMGCMTCCSGPISIYRFDLLNELLLQKFITQSFLKVPCEPGDDRHLTNLILCLGYSAKQTNLAIAGTEAPNDLFRFLKQQLRWSRSFYREMYWQLKSIPKQSHYLCIISLYEFLFPFLVSIWIFFSLYYNFSFSLLLKNGYLSIGILLIRTLLLYIYTLRLNMFYNIIYYPIYLIFLLPTKLFALFTLLNNQWETQSRNQLLIQCINYCSFHFIFIYLWNISLIFPILYHLFIFFNNK